MKIRFHHIIYFIQTRCSSNCWCQVHLRCHTCWFGEDYIPKIDLKTKIDWNRWRCKMFSRQTKFCQNLWKIGLKEPHVSPKLLYMFKKWERFSNLDYSQKNPCSSFLKLISRSSEFVPEFNVSNREIRKIMPGNTLFLSFEFFPKFSFHLIDVFSHIHHPNSNNGMKPD